jgi:hypothetical protein
MAELPGQMYKCAIPRLRERLRLETESCQVPENIKMGHGLMGECNCSIGYVHFAKNWRSSPAHGIFL